MKFAIGEPLEEPARVSDEPAWNRVTLPRWPVRIGFSLGVGAVYATATLLVRPLPIGVGSLDLLALLLIMAGIWIAFVPLNFLVLAVVGGYPKGAVLLWSKKRRMFFNQFGRDRHSREHYIFVHLAPFLVLCVLPIVAFRLLTSQPSAWVLIPSFAGLLCVDNLLVAIVLLTRIPWGAIVWEAPGALYWRSV